MTDAIVASISERYKELFAQVTGKQLPAIDYAGLEHRIEKSIMNSIK